MDETLATQIKRLTERRNRNFDLLEALSRFLTVQPRGITPELMTGMSDDPAEEEFSYCTLVASACGMDLENSPDARALFWEYLIPGIKKLDPAVFIDNPYYRTVRVPCLQAGRWELKHEQYQPYEAFVRDDLLLQPDFREIARIGYFAEGFCFPALLEDGREWMTVTPNEIQTMIPALDAANGRVVTFGLGLGYFAFMASIKPTVSHVTVIERDESLIRLFVSQLLPQFPCRDKLTVLSADAFDYARKMGCERYDFAFTDLWHDAGDGLPAYLRMKRLEHASPGTSFAYWIENSLLSRLRWLVFDQLCELSDQGWTGDFTRYLNHSFLRGLAANPASDPLCPDSLSKLLLSGLRAFDSTQQPH